MKLTFLGTSAGVPTLFRNTSSLALLLGSETWLFDCGEGTQHRFLHSTLKIANIQRIFITHMHPDHILGLVPLLLAVCQAEVSPTDGKDVPSNDQRIIDIYGPSGTRELVRTTLRLTQSRMQIPYRVHELLFPDETPYPQDLNDRNKKEAEGQDIVLSNIDKTWCVIGEPTFNVRAAPILHTIRCIGYVVEQFPPLEKLDINILRPLLMRNAAVLAQQGIKNPLSILGELQKQLKPITLPDGTILNPPSRVGPTKKAVILGDTYDASGIVAIAYDADILVHECTNGYVPELERVSSTRTESSVREDAKTRGHSTPEVAGDLARRIRAKRLVLNHFSARYSDPYCHRFDIDQTVLNSNELSGAVRNSKVTYSATEEDLESKEVITKENSKGKTDNNPTLKYLDAMSRKADQAWGRIGTVMARDYLVVSIT